MKVVAINGSPRKNGNTYQSLRIVGDRLEAQGIDVEYIQLGGKPYYGCTNCGGCAKSENNRCVMPDEMVGVIETSLEADGLLIGSPVYYSNVTAEIKAFIDRCGRVNGAKGGKLRRKIGAPVIAVRRSGANFTYAAINFFFGITQMQIATSSYWNMTLSRDPGEVQSDEEGIRTFRTLADNMGWLLKNTSEKRDEGN